MDRLNSLLSFLEDDPNDAFLLFAVAKEYERTGNDENALKYYRKNVDVNTDYVATFYHLGTLLGRQGEYRRAVGVLDQGLLVASRLKDTHTLGELQAAKAQFMEFLEEE